MHIRQMQICMTCVEFKVETIEYLGTNSKLPGHKLAYQST